MSRRKCSILVLALGLALVAGCGGGGEPAGQDANATITATATVTATANAATPPGELRPFSPTKVLSDLVERDIHRKLRNIAQAICEEVRTGDPDTSLPWRELIGYLGERRGGVHRLLGRHVLSKGGRWSDRSHGRQHQPGRLRFDDIGLAV